MERKEMSLREKTSEEVFDLGLGLLKSQLGPEQFERVRETLGVAVAILYDPQISDGSDPVEVLIDGLKNLREIAPDQHPSAREHFGLGVLMLHGYTAAEKLATHDKTHTYGDVDLPAPAEVHPLGPLEDYRVILADGLGADKPSAQVA